MRRQALIAEDNPEQQLVLQRLARIIDPELGIRVVDSYEGAVAALGSSSEPYDWVLSDLYLAGDKTGADLFKFCRTWFPGTQVALISGASGREIDGLLSGFGDRSTVIPKSAPLKDLKAMLERLISPVRFNSASSARTEAGVSDEALIANLSRLITSADQAMATRDPLVPVARALTDLAEPADPRLARDIFYTLAVGAGLLLASVLIDSAPRSVWLHSAPSVKPAAKAPLVQAFQDADVQKSVRKLLGGGLTPLVIGARDRVAR